MKNKEYLGDGVYATNDRYNIQLTTEDGQNVHNTIFLEPTVFSALIAYSKKHIGQSNETK